MALDRTNMVSLLDVGKMFGGETSNLMEMGDGFNELTEDFNPDVQTTQYVNMKTKASTVSGYEFSVDAEREYLSDEMQTYVDKACKNLPTGTDCESYYYRFYKTDLTTSGDTSTGDCIRIPVVVCPSSTGGSGGETLVSSLEIHGNGDVEQGTVTIDAEGKYTWAAAE